MGVKELNCFMEILCIKIGDDLGCINEILTEKWPLALIS